MINLSKYEPQGEENEMPRQEEVVDKDINWLVPEKAEGLEALLGSV